MTELDSESQELAAFYERERKELEKAVEEGSLKKIAALNGNIYFIHLAGDLGDRPVAMSNDKIVIWEGNKVLFNRGLTNGKPWRESLVVTGLTMNKESNQIEFQLPEEFLFTRLTPGDAFKNLTTEKRLQNQVKQTRANGKNVS